MTAEATLRGAILHTVRLDYPPSKREVLVFGRPAGAATGPGHPDLFGVARGRFFALEIKTLKSKPSPLQVQHIQDLRAAGAYAWVVRSPMDATRAVYQAKIGGPVPTPNDPIDFDDWFKEIVPAGTPHPIETAAAEAGIPVSAPVEEERDPANGVAPPASLPTVDDIQAARDAGLLGADMPDVAPTPPITRIPEPAIMVGVMDPASSQAILVELVKAVGDRVTLLYEQGDKQATLLRAAYVAVSDLTKETISLRQTLNTLLADVGAEEGVEPSPLMELPDLADLPPPTPQRRRRSKAS